MKNFLCLGIWVVPASASAFPSIEHGLVFFLVPCGNQNHYTDEVIYAMNMKRTPDSSSYCIEFSYISSFPTIGFRSYPR